MAPLTAARRRELAREGKANADGSFPTDTRGRAIAAKGRAAQAEASGRISKQLEARIDARADRQLGKGNKK